MPLWFGQNRAFKLFDSRITELSHRYQARNKSMSVQRQPEIMMESQREILTAFKEKRISVTEAREKLANLSRASRMKEQSHQIQESSTQAQESNNQLQMSSHKNDRSEPIAIIGISGRFPGAKNVQEFWNNLANGVDSIIEIPKERWDIDAYFDPEPGIKGKIYSRYAGFVDDIDQFDPKFFNISPREAKEMDPQYRIFLQETWNALEDAGCTPSSLSGQKIGLFIGGSIGDYPGGSVYTPSTEAGRIAYLFDWKGPCICIETTCSSTLVALHEAGLHLQSGQLEMAIVGGVSLMITPLAYLGYSYVSALSPTGKCYPFDKRADGTIFSESICSVVLKPLSSALSNHDHIYGIIKGSGINYDGKTNGLTAPSGKAQMALEIDTYNRFHINPEQITMMEAHGTATKLGDPIEVNALIKAFNQFTPNKGFCSLGSVKSNIGHTGPAAGLVGLIKVLLSIQHQKIPPTIHYQDINPSISLQNSPFYINTTLRDWETAHNAPRMAAVSAFGFSGTNAHVVIEEYLEKAELQGLIGHPQHEGPYIIVLSAKNEDRLKEYAGKLLAFLPKNSTTAAELEKQPQLLEEKIGATFAELLQVDQAEIDLNEKFDEYGVEPIHQSQLLEKLQQQFNIEIDSTAFLKMDTLASIVTYLIKNYSKPLKTGQPNDDRINLADLAYTLQVGREAMEERLGFIVESIQELREKLSEFQQQLSSRMQDDVKGIYRGKVKLHNNSSTVFDQQELSEATIEKWIQQRKFVQIGRTLDNRCSG
jgi:acyl transferase domain-containing protein/acyl carrier protein